MSYAQTLTESQKQLAQTYGIELATSYSPLEVIQILEVIDQELIEGIKAAYEEGYKQGVKEWKPKAIAYQTESEIAKSDLEQIKQAQSRKLLKYSIISGCTGLFVGSVSTLLIGMKINF